MVEIALARMQTATTGAFILAAIGLSCGGGSKVTAPTIPSPAALAGRVTSLGTGGPIAGAIVQFTDGPNAGRSVVTDQIGNYRMEDLASGRATVIVTSSLFADDIRTVTLTGSTTLDIRLRRGACEGADVGCALHPTPCNETMPMFRRPFLGDYVTTNLMDHDVPLQFRDANGIFRSYCGGPNGPGGIDSHSGYDWLLPIGTPLLAVAAGTVRFAGTDPPFFCPTLNRSVNDQMVVLIDHTSPNGETFTSVYVHLSQINVQVGEAVAGGQEIGLSGNTGCSTQAHLHFEVRRVGNSGARVVTDPYGWQGSGVDPWAQDPQGAASVWLWIDAPNVP